VPIAGRKSFREKSAISSFLRGTTANGSLPAPKRRQGHELRWLLNEANLSHQMRYPFNVMTFIDE